MDWEIVLLVISLVSAVIAFLWRRTRVKAYYYIWLGLIWLDIQARKIYTKKNPDDPKPDV